MDDPEGGLEELLAEAQDLQSAGAFDLDAFCSAHPDHAAALRAHLGLLPLADRALRPGAGTRSERDRVRGAVRRMVAADADGGALKGMEAYKNLFPGFWDIVAEEHRRASAAARHVLASAPTLKGGGDAAAASTFTGAVGDRLGSYRLLRELGRGGMGVVYLAEDERLRRRAALKILSPVFASSDVLRRRFEREAAVASRLDHPGICTVFEAGEIGGVPFIAMRYVEGETLEHWIHVSRTAAGLVADPGASRVTRLPHGSTEADEAVPDDPGEPPGGSGGKVTAGTREEVRRVLLLVERASRALHVAHEAGLIHRDIKPGNIMITPGGDPVLLDFGLARDEEGVGLSLTQTGALMGTPAYMSPEQIAAHRIRLDRRTDVYSMGVTLYEALTLRLPFRAASRDSLYQKILATDPENPRRLNPVIPADLRVVIDKVMEKDRERRYPTAEEFAEELRRVRVDEPIAARPPGTATRIRRWGKRNPGKAGALLVAAALVAGGPVAISVVGKAAVKAARDRMNRDSLLSGFRVEIERAERSSRVELQLAASKLRNADAARGGEDREAARRLVEDARKYAEGILPDGAELAGVATRILEILDRESANR